MDNDTKLIWGLDLPPGKHRFIGVVIAMALIPALSGCSLQGVPIVSEPTTYVGGTLVDHLQWVEEEIDKAIAVSGVKEGWFKSFSGEEIEWTDDPKSRYEIFGSLLPRACGSGGALVQNLVVRDVPKWAEIAERMRAAWEADGWVVMDVFSVDRPSNPYFRADREDGAVLALNASEKGMILSVESPCSGDPTMSTRTLRLEERDAYLKEMLERPYSRAEE